MACPQATKPLGMGIPWLSSLQHHQLSFDFLSFTPDLGEILSLHFGGALSSKVRCKDPRGSD